MTSDTICLEYISVFVPWFSFACFLRVSLGAGTYFISSNIKALKWLFRLWIIFSIITCIIKLTSKSFCTPHLNVSAVLDVVFCIILCFIIFVPLMFYKTYIFFHFLAMVLFKHCCIIWLMSYWCHFTTKYGLSHPD